MSIEANKNNRNRKCIVRSGLVTTFPQPKLIQQTKEQISMFKILEFANTNYQLLKLNEKLTSNTWSIYIVVA